MMRVVMKDARHVPTMAVPRAMVWFFIRSGVIEKFSLHG